MDVDLKHLMNKYTWLIILVAIVLSFVFPEIGMPVKPYLIYLLMVLMFFGCLNVNLKELFGYLKDSKKLIMVLAVIHLVSPLIIFMLKPFFSDEIFLGLILASVISSGMSVVFLSKLYGGIASEALVITSLSNILSPLTVPFLVVVFARTNIEVDAVAMVLTMVKLVVIPVALSITIGKTRLRIPLSNYGTYISLAVLFFLIMGIISPVREIIMSNIQQALILSGLISILVIINFMLGHLIGSNKQEKMTYSISASYKNFTLATVIALSLFSPLVALPAIIYTVVNNALLAPLQLIFVRK
jgi:bile acid:Na+ symporter, BASS family